jgi:endonuclease/exonuclease/phosphatase family metal-dependent hydrolase
MTWNVMGDVDDREHRADRIAAVLAESSSDVILLQECWPEVLAAITDQGAFKVATESFITPVDRGVKEGCAVLAPTGWASAPLPLLLDAPNPYGKPERIPAAAGEVTTPAGRRWWVCSAHLSWGAEVEHVRVAQARTLDTYATTSGTSAQILGGDFNATPESATVRRLTGLDPWAPEGPTSYWVDAHRIAGEGSGFTSVVQGNVYGHRTALNGGVLRPELIPPRRIDYLLVRGYAHGRVGSVLAAWSLPLADNPSDHLPVLADVYDPLP